MHIVMDPTGLTVSVAFLLTSFGHTGGQIPMFEECQTSDRCEKGTECRFNVCLPQADPVPVFVYDTPEQQVSPHPIRTTHIPITSKPIYRSYPMRSHTTLPSSLRQIEQPQLGTMFLQQDAQTPSSIHNVVVQAPPGTANPPKTNSPRCPPGCELSPRCAFGHCTCVPIKGQTISPQRCMPFGHFRSHPSTRPSPAQAVLGEACGLNTECTGGSICIQQRCQCPSELVESGDVCVSPAIFGLPHRGLPGYYSPTGLR